MNDPAVEAAQRAWKLEDTAWAIAVADYAERDQ